MIKINSYRRGRSGQSNKVDPRVEEIINKIRNLDKFSSYPVKEFAEEKGDADIIAEVCRGSLKSAQMRRFFDQSRTIQRDLKYRPGEYETNWEKASPKISMLQPLLRYANARRVIPKDFLQVMIASLGKIDVGSNEKDKIDNYFRFMEFFQAIVAYHKFYNP